MTSPFVVPENTVNNTETAKHITTPDTKILKIRHCENLKHSHITELHGKHYSCSKGKHSKFQFHLITHTHFN